MLGKKIPVSDATYLYSLAKSITEKYDQLYQRISLTGYANNNHNKVEVLKERVKQQEKVITGFLDVWEKYLTDKITKKQAVERSRDITVQYTRNLDEKSAIEEWLGKPLTDEEYEAFKKSNEFKKFKEHYES